jgi:hypothetical protein
MSGKFHAVRQRDITKIRNSALIILRSGRSEGDRHKCCAENRGDGGGGGGGVDSSGDERAVGVCVGRA